MKSLISALLLLPLCLSLGAASAASIEPAQSTEEAIARVVPTYVMILGGSGVVISEDGLMITNHHVINAAYVKDKSKDKKTEIPVRVGNVFRKARILGTDPRGDITLLQIKLNDGEKLPYVEFADSDKLKVGQQVMAIGNPFSTMQVRGDPTVTIGIISLLHWFQQGYSDAIVTDTPINPGNSGGPLLTMDGRLAGINGRMRSKTGVRANTGIGMAIPANQIARFIPLLKEAKGGVILHGALRGVKFDGREEDGLRNGAEVSEVLAGKAAEESGLMVGDRIVEVAGLPIPDPSRFLGITQAYPENATVSATIIRGDEELTLDLHLQPIDPGTTGFDIRRPKNQKEIQRVVKKLRENAKEEIAFPIVKIKKNSPAAKAGLKKGDQIIAINGEPTPNFHAYEQLRRTNLANSAWFAGDAVTLRYRRGKGDEAEEKEVSLTLDSRIRPGS